jgi:CsoR family transcriptional regulator, copper-sensing transcriptional repressor
MPRGIPRDNSIKRRILHRLKVSRGHLDRVIGMVEKGDYCIDVIHQSQAVQAALKNVDQVILENHLNTCVADSVKRGDAKEVISEVMKVIKKNG